MDDKKLQPTTQKLLLKCEELDDAAPHPHCAHGPTLLFYQQDEGPGSGYYACAAHRDKKSCSYQVPVTAVTERLLSKRYETPTQEYRALRKQFLSCASDEQRHFCHSCNVPLLQTQLPPHAGHALVRNLSAQLLQNPTLFLRPLDNDKVQAQYFFDHKALKFFEKALRDLQISKVICMGAPRLHAHLRSSTNIQSFLLDFDQRFYYFYEDQQFAWYNMCNNYFYDKKQEREFEKFLKSATSSERLLIFTDPPFGCRTEPIAHTLQQLTQRYNRLNALPHQPLPIFWVFPYFSANYVQQALPALQMCDYKINYTNHLAYTDTGGGRKLGSPVRLFTNVPLAKLLLPITEQYKYCAPCERYTALENRHCTKCNACAALNGATYHHCNKCDMCVKPSYVHCDECRRCTLPLAHNCSEYQLRQRCWICGEVGHTELKCEQWQHICKKRKMSKSSSSSSSSRKITCLLCDGRGHNERRCSKRAQHIHETSFLGEKQLQLLA